jgi:hypothetical protein
LYKKRTLSPSLKGFDVVGDGHPALRALRPGEVAWPEPACVIKSAGFEGKHVRYGLQNVIDTDSALGTEHARNSLPLSAIRANCFVRPVTVRLSFFTGMAMPKALPDWRWHSLQWQAPKRFGSFVNT